MELFQQNKFIKIDFLLFLFQVFLHLKVNLKRLLRKYRNLKEMHLPNFPMKNYFK